MHQLLISNLKLTGNGEGMRVHMRHAANIYASMNKKDEGGVQPKNREKEAEDCKKLLMCHFKIVFSL